MTREDLDTLEGILDRSGYAGTLEALADIANEKADHVRTNWQDAPLARCWEYASKRTRTVARIVAREYAI